MKKYQNKQDSEAMSEEISEEIHEVIFLGMFGRNWSTLKNLSK